MSSQPGKDTIYIDVDDEITAIIDKVRSSHERIVALVLPKRATVFQSIVNMKLLKRTADEAKKHLVLITGEAGLLPLAGSVGLYVAKTLQSRPEVPTVAGADHRGDEAEEAVDMAAATEEKLDPSRAVGAYAAGSAEAADDLDEDDTIDLDNSTSAGAATAASKKPKKGGRRFSIPDFNKFRTWIVIGGAALVVLIFMGYFALVVMPRATVTVKTDSTAVAANFDLKLDTAAQDADVEAGVIPAVLQQTQKTATQQAEATGQKNNGQKASGQVTVTNCSTANVNIPAGTGFSSGSQTYVSTASAEVPKSGYEFTSGGFKCKNDGTKTINVTAQTGGAVFNAEPRAYSIANVTQENVRAQGGKMDGGTDQISKIVAQADIDGASQKLSAQDTTAIKSELQKALESQGLYVVGETFTAGKPEVTASAKVGDEAANVTITQKTTYTMVGTKQADLKKLIANAVNEEIDPTKQSILDYGIDSSVFKMQSQQGTRTLVLYDGTAIAGSDLNIEEIKKQIAGKKANDAKSIIGDYPGVSEVKVEYSPFWVKSIPKKAGKITITVEKPVINNAKQQ